MPAKYFSIFILLGFSLATQMALAQGDFAPYQSSQQMQNILAKRQAVAQKPMVRQQRPRDTGQDAIVKTDGAAIYSAPNFDAPVLGYLDSGRRIRVSKTMFSGIGGLGYFYRVIVRPHEFGYITDIDIILKGQKQASHGGESGSSSDSGDDNEPTNIYLSRYIGLSYYNYNFSEKISNSVRSANTTMFGAKFLGPTSLLGGLPLDFDLLYTSTAPSFYNDIATSTSGFMVMGDMLASLPITQTQWFLLTVDFGLMTRYSSWSVSLKNQAGKPAIDSQELTMGVLGELSASFRLTRKFALRGDVREAYEKERYAGLGLALDYRY